jgi:hypothetical protein
MYIHVITHRMLTYKKTIEMFGDWAADTESVFDKFHINHPSRVLTFTIVLREFECQKIRNNLSGAYWTPRDNSYAPTAKPYQKSPRSYT